MAGISSRSENERRIEDAAPCGDYFGWKRQVGESIGNAAQLWSCAGSKDGGGHL